MSTLFSSAPWSPHPLRRLALPMTALLVAAVAYSAARLTWEIIPAQAQPAPPQPRSASVDADSSPGGTPLETIAHWHLFGKAGTRTGEPDRIDAPETRLALELKGVFYSPDAGYASALISGSRQGTRRYREGDSLAGGRVEAIYEDRVVLHREGAHETLPLGGDRVPLDRTLADLDAIHRDGDRASGERNELEHYRQQLAEDPARLSQMVSLQPATENGEMVGVRVTPGEDERIMELLGLEPDDVVVAIGGTTLDTPASAFQAVQGLDGNEPVELRVRRDGSERTLQLEFN